METKPTLTIKYTLTKEARIAAALAGHARPREETIHTDDPAAITRAVKLGVTIGEEGHLALSRFSVGLKDGPLVLDAVPIDIHEVLSRVEALLEAANAEQQENERRLEVIAREWIDRNLPDRIHQDRQGTWKIDVPCDALREITGLHELGQVHQPSWWIPPSLEESWLATVRSLSPETLKVTRKECSRRNAAAQAVLEAERERVRAELEAERESMTADWDAWCRTHGSEVRRIVEAGYTARAAVVRAVRESLPIQPDLLIREVTRIYDAVSWTDRDSPSEAALDLEQRIKEVVAGLDKPKALEIEVLGIRRVEVAPVEEYEVDTRRYTAVVARVETHEAVGKSLVRYWIWRCED